MNEALGLSVGSTNLVAAPRPSTGDPAFGDHVVGQPARRVSVPSENPELTSPNLTEAGLVLQGFVERPAIRCR